MEAPETGAKKDGGQQEAREVHTVPEVTMEAGVVDFRDRNGVVSGSMYQGGVIRGSANVRIEGEVRGAPQHPCVIEISGSLTLERSVEYARIQARDLAVRGDATGCKVHLDLGGDVQGSLSGAEVSMGNRSGDIQALRHFRVDHQRMKEKREELDVRLGLAARRFVRNYPQVSLEIGNILVPEKRELRVDLKPFYQAVEGRPEAVVDKALSEFYLRVVVGTLTRANKHYVSRNPSRQKVFLKLIEDLREHIMSIREADKLEAGMEALVARRKALVEELMAPVDFGLRVGGEVGDNVAVQLVRIGQIDERIDGPVALDKRVLEARIADTEEGRGLQITDAEGNREVVPIGGEGLQNGSFVSEGDRLVWQPAG